MRCTRAQQQLFKTCVVRSRKGQIQWTQKHALRHAPDVLWTKLTDTSKQFTSRADMSDDPSKIGLQHPAFAVSKNTLLSWLNDFFELNYTKVEECATGAVYCQILDCIYPGTAESCIISYRMTFIPTPCMCFASKCDSCDLS